MSPVETQSIFAQNPIPGFSDSRIRVFHKSNGGVSSARNLGLIHATGEWILFVDADDWLSDDYLTLDKTALHSDIIQKSYVIIDENHTVQEEHKVSSKVLNKQYDIYYFFLNKRNNALWDKFIHHSLIKEHRFDINVKVGEDFLFFLEISAPIFKVLFLIRGNGHHP